MYPLLELLFVVSILGYMGADPCGGIKPEVITPQAASF